MQPTERTTTRYREILRELRLTFPQPVSDRVHDSYLVHLMMRALDQVDAMKSQHPILGECTDYDLTAAGAAELQPAASSIEHVTSILVQHLNGMTIYGHPRTQQNVMTQPTIASVIGTLLSSLYNPNLSWDGTSNGFAMAEVEVIAMLARLVGYDPLQAGGVFTFGGTGTSFYGCKIGLEKACPGAMERGVRDDAVIVASDASHYCKATVAGWLGLGTRNVVVIPTNDQNEMVLDRFDEACRGLLKQGRKIAAIIVTLGTTDAFGLDDLDAILEHRDRMVADFSLSYVPHVHADAVIGWAWSVFNDYDLEVNPLGFRPRTLRALAGARHRIRHLHRADSIGVDLHKTGFAPYISSAVLVRNRTDFTRLSRDRAEMPYLYQYGDYKPGTFTLETSLPGNGIFAALANLKLFGREGLQTMLGHLVEMAHLLRDHLGAHAFTHVLNGENFGTVTLFRAYPDGVDTFTVPRGEFTDPAYRDSLLRHNDYNRRLAEIIHDEARQGRGVLTSMTECYRQTLYGEPIVALKSYILSPFVDEVHVEAVMRQIIEARQRLARGN